MVGTADAVDHGAHFFLGDPMIRYLVRTRPLGDGSEVVHGIECQEGRLHIDRKYRLQNVSKDWVDLGGLESMPVR
jgi:hypothetical protein